MKRNEMTVINAMKEGDLKCPESHQHKADGLFFDTAPNPINIKLRVTTKCRRYDGRGENE